MPDRLTSISSSIWLAKSENGRKQTKPDGKLFSAQDAGLEGIGQWRKKSANVRKVCSKTPALSAIHKSTLTLMSNLAEWFARSLCEERLTS